MFCLAEAPTADAAEAVHRESHGLIGHQIIEVDGRAVMEFLGKLREPKPGEPWVATAFRTILFTDMEGSFTSVVRAIECSIDIQRRIAEHNEKAEVPFRVRMGLSAGEPVTESNRLFGAAIQLAARTCACADGSQIFASNVVRELCLGKEFVFEDRGQFPLKGFGEPVQLFEVSWQVA